MQYRTFEGKSISQLAFGAMRLPTLEDGSVDEDHVAQMVDYAYSHGVNYFDTAYPYHGGLSELVLGRVLSAYPRDSFYLATKYPGHQLASSYDPRAVFEEQLQKCGVEYFDFYLLHNVYENSLPVYLDERWGIIDYFKEQRAAGRIKHLGFSTHGLTPTVREFLDATDDAMEFCQMQLNYLDWKLRDAQGLYDLLVERGLPIWVMEPLRGGKLCQLPASAAEQLEHMRPGASQADWAFRWLQDLPAVTTILSGMSNLQQVEQNVAIFETEAPLDEANTQLLQQIAKQLYADVGCTACGYCLDSCPLGLSIPEFMAAANDQRFAGTTTQVMYVESLPEDKRPSACIACGACARACPQKIDIPAIMAELSQKLADLPSWESLCREREEAARRLRED